MINRYELSRLGSDYASTRMHYQGDRAQKAYRGHISRHDNQWVAYATYGPANSPDRGRALVGSGQNLVTVVDALNERLEEKMNKGYRVVDALVYDARVDVTEVERTLEAR